VDLRALYGKANATAEHEVIEEELKVFNGLDIYEVTVVQGCCIELLDKWGSQLPQRTTRHRAAQVEHVVEKRFGFFLRIRSTDLNRPIDNPLNRFGPRFIAPKFFNVSAVGSKVDDLPKSPETPWGLLGLV
jgi:hypothetical protein